MSNFFIPDPCHENWNKMTPSEQGRHCAVCSKVVVDFTQKKDEEINQIMAEQPGKVCGHFKVDQLNHAAQLKVFKQPSNLFNRNWKYLAMATFGFFSLNKQSEAQQLKGKPMPIRGDVAPVEHHNTNTAITNLYGMVQQSNGKPAGGALVVVSSNGVEIARATTMANGTYSMKIQPGKIAQKTVDIVVSYSHAATKYISSLNLPHTSNKLNITLDEQFMLKGEVEYIAPPVVDTVKNDVPVVPIAPLIHDETVTNCALQEPQPEQKDTAIKTAVVTEDTAEKDLENEDQIPVTISTEEITATIYPNPAGTYATIHCTRQATYKVELYDEKGALKLTKAFYGSRTDLDVSTFARGHYFVKVRDDQDHAYVMKLVKQ